MFAVFHGMVAISHLMNMEAVYAGGEILQFRNEDKTIPAVHGSDDAYILSDTLLVHQIHLHCDLVGIGITRDK